MHTKSIIVAAIGAAGITNALPIADKRDPQLAPGGQMQNGNGLPKSSQLGQLGHGLPLHHGSGLPKASQLGQLGHGLPLHHESGLPKASQLGQLGHPSPQGGSMKNGFPGGGHGNPL